MNKEFVSYEQALALKELGFDESCFAVYSEHDKTRVYDESAIREGLKIQAPLYQQAFRWFREKYGIFNPQRLIFETLGGKYGLQSHDEHDQVDGYFDTYEEAELSCLNKLIEIVEYKSE